MNNLATKEKSNKLILNNRNMARKITYYLYTRIKFPRYLMEDCISQGYLGLIEAARKYSDKRNLAFSTYAGIIIKGRIIDYIRKYFKIKFGSKYNFDKHTPPSHRDITVKRLEDESENRQIISCPDLEFEKNYHFKHKTTKENYLLKEINDGIEELENRDVVKHFFSKLTPREQKIFYLNFYQNMSCQKIAKQLGVSRSWIAKIQQDALTKYREWEYK